MSFEAITTNLVDQENFTELEKVGEDITIRAERVGTSHYLIIMLASITTPQNSTSFYKADGVVFNPTSSIGMFVCHVQLFQFCVHSPTKPLDYASTPSAAHDDNTFSNSTDDNNSTSLNTTNENSNIDDPVARPETNASFNRIFIPPTAFENTTNNRTGVIFSLYSSDILFPLRLNQSENDTYKAIGSGVLSATVAGEKIQGLKQMVNVSMSIIVSVSSYLSCMPTTQ